MEIMLIIHKKSSDNDNLEMFPLHYRYFCIFFIDLIDGNLLISPHKCLQNHEKMA